MGVAYKNMADENVIAAVRRMIRETEPYFSLLESAVEQGLGMPTGSEPEACVPREAITVRLTLPSGRVATVSLADDA